MEYLTIILVAFSAIFVLHGLNFTLSRRGKKLPPGPTPLPIIGNLHLLGGQPHKSLAELAKKHGPIMCLKLGTKTTVVISSPAMAKEVLHKQDLTFSTRSISDAGNIIDHPSHSVVYLPVGPKWRSLRKIMTLHIFSNNRLDANQEIRRTKVKELITYCRKSCQPNEVIEIGRASFTTILNLLTNTLFSEDVTYRGQEFKDLFRQCLVEAGKPNVVDFFPVLRKLDPQGNRRRAEASAGKLLKIVDCIVDERLKQRESQGIVENDLLDIFLSISEENPQEMDRDDIVHMFLDLLIAGTDTSSSTIEWAMAELIRNPDIMEKAKNELAQVIGKGKVIEDNHVAHLPYLASIVKETLRLHPPVPFLIPRKVQEDVQVHNYCVPKDSQVLVNAWAIGRDSSVWADPLIFKPERFLGSEIDVRGQDFELIPFGAGRRICPGLPLGMKMVHLILGSLLNSFDWELENHISLKKLDMEETFGITLQKSRPLRAIPMPT